MESIRGEEEAKPYRVGTYCFKAGNGLYLIVGYSEDRALHLAEDLLGRLSYSGIGGKRASGMGQFTFYPGKMPQEIQRRLTGTGSKYMTLSVSLPRIDEMRRQGIRSSELKPLVRYELDCGDAAMEKGRTIQMMECIKDPYGNPYIPGTSLKGMFRTIFLCEDMIKNPDKYRQERSSMEREVMSDDMRVNRMTFLKRQVGDVEEKRYRTLGKDEKKPSDAVNDQLQGFVVSDSEPLSVRDLVLCQKVDRHPDGTEKTLPILRECIKPGTEIRFTITIDTSVCDLDEEKIKAAVKAAIQNYYSNFQKAFDGFDLPRVNYVYLGGGSGFVSKTMIYAMYGKQRGIELTQRIFDKTKVPRNHKHYKDKEYGASPHILKCTRYQGRTLQMCLCRITKIEPCEA